MEEMKPAKVEIKVTWGFAWALYWRWMLFGIAFAAIFYAIAIIVILAGGFSLDFPTT